jgi:uncharacterized protein YdeI (YjbR/CyaY-like superfamily)
VESNSTQKRDYSFLQIKAVVIRLAVNIAMKTKPFPRTGNAMTIPPDLKKALASNSDAKLAFEKLPPSHRKEYLTWLADAKKPETLQRRIEKIIPMLLRRQN